jgi:hypothetical protein
VATEVRDDTRSTEAPVRRGRRGRTAVVLLVAGLSFAAGAAALSLVPVRVGLNDGTSLRCGVSVTRLTSPLPTNRWALQTAVLISRHRLDAHGPGLPARCSTAIDHRLGQAAVALSLGVLAAGAGAVLLRTRRPPRAPPLTAHPVPTASPAAPATVRPRGVSLDYIPGLDGFRGVAVIAVLAARLDEVIDMARRGGARVALLTAPFYEEGEQPNGNQWPEDRVERVRRFNALLHEAVARHPRDATVVDLNGLLCPHGRYERVVGGTAVRWNDGVHITSAGGALVRPTLTRQVLALASAP